jgi:universal stress protein A
MPIYNRILAVVDLTADSTQVAARALEIARTSPDAALTLLHVVEFAAIEPLNDSLLPAVQVEAELLQAAQARLGAMVISLADPRVTSRVATGNAKGEIIRCAREGRFDLIVIGSHERHGLSILVNLTEDTVLHAAPCDVLGVRLAATRAT